MPESDALAEAERPLTDEEIADLREAIWAIPRPTEGPMQTLWSAALAVVTSHISLASELRAARQARDAALAAIDRRCIEALRTVNRASRDGNQEALRAAAAVCDETQAIAIEARAALAYTEASRHGSK